MKNKEIARIFSAIADILEIKDEEPFRVNAYRRAARIIDDLAVDIADLAESGELTSVGGIGKGTAEKIVEYLKTGRMRMFDEVRKGVPEGLTGLLAISGMGPKTVGLVWRELGVTSLAKLKKTLRGDRILDLPGMGKKKVENIKAGVKAYESRSDRMTLGDVLPTAREVIGKMKEVKAAGRVEVAGSVRRWRETIGDIDVLVSSGKPRPVVDAFTNLSCVEEVLQAGTTKASIRATGTLQIDLRVVPAESYGAALQYFTGSKAHNVRLREIAREKGYKLNEYGLFKGERRVAGRTERSIYTKLGLAYVDPELREDRGEVEAASKSRLPTLVGRKHIRGDLHVHSNWSDGASELREIAEMGSKMGYEYVAICDHSRSLGIAGGLSIERVEEQMEAIKKLNGRLSGIALLAGTEAEIRSDGSMDFPDDVLARLDVVVASVHSGFTQSRDRITGRILDAMANPHVDIVAHPTGRLLGIRPAYEVDLERVMTAAAETGTALEINAYHQRLDLSDVNARRAAELGVMLSIGTDAHNTDQMWMIELGVGTARRGWLGPKALLNALGREKLLDHLGTRPGPPTP